MTTIRTRFAPSPTGSLHVGGVRTALYCLLHSRHMKGDYVLRVEDTDQKRSTNEAMQGILRDLDWLGLTADEDPKQGGPFGPYMQSERLSIYNSYFDQLIESGHAYLAWETVEELQTLRLNAQKEKRNFRYQRVNYTPEQLQRFTDEGRTPILRLAHPKHSITVNDLILGDVNFPTDELEDIIIRKADGFPTYHFAVVVDDHLMQISQVMRGSEHLMNTPKHIGLMEALGWDRPKFAHLPIIMSMSGSKMSKRDKAKTAREGARLWKKSHPAPKDDWSELAELTGLNANELLTFMKKKNNLVPIAEAIANTLNLSLPMIDVSDFRKGGYLPEALLNYLALLGWSPGDDRELMSIDEMTELFSLERVGKTPAKFDSAKLNWMNGEYIKSATDERLIQAIRSYTEVNDGPLKAASDEQLTQLIAMYRLRVQTLADLEKAAHFFFIAPTEWNAKAARKHLLKGGGLERLRLVLEALTPISEWNQEPLQACLEHLVSVHDLSMGKFAQPIRVAVTGTAVSPDIYDTLVFLGQSATLSRIERCLSHFSKSLHETP